jgi:hypothetical protein
VIYYGIGQIFF